MRILVVGGGGREHALIWRFKQDDPSAQLHVAPGNAGMASEATIHAVAVDDTPGLLSLALRIQPDLVVVGPEATLAAGLTDMLTPHGIAVFGPNVDAAQLETSKLFAKDVMASCGVPTAKHWVVEDEASLQAAVTAGARVLKADGLAAGKGVVVADDVEAALAAGRDLLTRFGAPLLGEERLTGREVSVMALCDGTRALMLPTAQDHKRLLDSDRGPNTGGMGTVSPGTHHGRVGVDEKTLLARVHDQVMLPVMTEMRARGMPFVGVLFAGLMVDPATGDFRVLEFNARLGDPETQVLLRRVDGNVAAAMMRCCEGDAAGVVLGILSHGAACVVMAAQGYPGTVRQNDVINGLPAAALVESVKVFHAATVLKEGSVVTRGGRVLGVSAVGETPAHALERAYSACALITWPGAQFRRDIGRNPP